MKTLELKLKKDVLIVDVDKSFNHFKIYDDEIGFIFTENCIPRKELLKGSYKFLCKGSGLTEEIASELVDETIMYEKHKVKCYRYRSYIEGFVGFDNSIESFISAVESKGFYWLENPEKYERNGYEIYADKNKLSRYISKEETASFKAEKKTFINPLIFVKND